MAGKSVTLADVARAANVSTGTVSRALSDSPRVADATKELVRRIAREQNFRINSTARNLRKRTSGTVALLLPADPKSGQMVSDPFFLDIIGAVADALQGTGYDLLLSTSGAHPDKWYEDFIASSRADGLIVVGQAYHGEALLELAQTNAPVVVWGAPGDDLPYCSVGSDNLAGGLAATRHLLALARQRIAFVGDRALPEVALRFSGYCTALAEAGMALDEALVVATPFTRDGAQAAVTALIESKNDFDAVFAASDLIAMSAIRILESKGHAVPQDVAVVGFDDIRMAADYNPPLTTVSQNILGGGRLLVSKLIELMRGEAVESESLEPKLMVRASTVAEAVIR